MQLKRRLITLCCLTVLTLAGSIPVAAQAKADKAAADKPSDGEYQADDEKAALP